MWANTCWGFLSLAVTFALARLSMIWTSGHEQWGAWLEWAAAVCAAISMLCFLWPLLSRNEWLHLRKKKIPFRRAATMAYEQLRATDSIWAKVADRFGAELGKTKEEGILLYMAGALQTRGIPLYGKHPPSQQHELIALDEFKRGGFGDGGNEFHYHGDKSPKYVELAVKACDLRKIISGMKKVSSDAIGRWN
ncbi:MAG: hypothetical protein HY847_09080 [Betaproteobacteria bacterium]|nr:hypothetical protein [Betaproteobacteria bacterium]